ncbi:MAG: ABC transporter ATP-binding protein [Treponema sp.]|jgi:oligopeptide transport system ATP-binding protein|nr:ABC transporter ATP-binding protein [Treponema sp.]
MTDKSNVILDVRGLSVSFSTGRGTVRAVRNLDLELRKGETLAIVGESGSGKSVTVKTLIGILSKNGRVDSGTALFRYREGETEKETDLLALSKKEMRRNINGKRISMIFQDPMTSLNPTMPVGAQIAETIGLHNLEPAVTVGEQLAENIRRHEKISRRAAAKRALELLEMVGMDDPERRLKSYPHQLSGGMRQRVVIAIALACGPEILICDEPTTALDVTIQERILQLIRDIQIKTGISVIYITHDMGVVAKVADYVTVMYAGRIVERGTAEDIFYDSRHPYTWGLLLAMPDLYTDDETLYTIPGNPPDLLQDINGDAFAARNPTPLYIDTRRVPPLFQISPTHYAASWLLYKNAPKLDCPAELRKRVDRMLKEAAYDSSAL